MNCPTTPDRPAGPPHVADTVTPGELIGRPGVMVVDCRCGAELDAVVGSDDDEFAAIDRAVTGHQQGHQRTAGAAVSDSQA